MKKPLNQAIRWLSVVPGAGVENIGLSEISLNGKIVKFAAKYAELH